jgi:hypothetical protein
MNDARAVCIADTAAATSRTRSGNETRVWTPTSREFLCEYSCTYNAYTAITCIGHCYSSYNIIIIVRIALYHETLYSSRSCHTGFVQE